MSKEENRCYECGKEGAEIKIREIDETGTLNIKYICRECAVKKGIIMAEKRKLMDIFNEFMVDVNENDERIVCKNCGTKFSEFKKTGLLGCEECYESFKTELTNLFSMIYNDDFLYKGDPPEKGENKIWKKYMKDYLKEKLEILVEKEDYERAARIRDILKNMGEA